MDALVQDHQGKDELVSTNLLCILITLILTFLSQVMITWGLVIIKPRNALLRASCYYSIIPLIGDQGRHIQSGIASCPIYCTVGLIPKCRISSYAKSCPH